MPSADAGETREIRWFSWLMATAALILIAATWRLWIPQTRFPQVPLIEAAGRLPLWADWGGGVLMIVALVTVLVDTVLRYTVLRGTATSRVGQIGLLLFVASVTVLILIDQHRLQPWTWQFLLIASILAMADGRRAVGLLQWLTVSIYLYSAISKLDVSFITGEGQQILDGLLRSLDLSITGWPESARRMATAGMPIGELFVAVGLCLRKTRRAALVAAVAMHVSLCLAVGPWGLHHKPGVLIWNVYFVMQDILLFARRPMMPAAEVWSLPVMRFLFRRKQAESARKQTESARRRSSRLAEALVLAAMVLPLLEPFGWFDQWPAWGLYASAPERLAVFVRDTERGHLPEAIRRQVEEPPPLHSWCRLRIDRWSLAVLDAPLYPQNRFRVGVVLAVAERYHLGSAIRVIVESSANRWTGRRTVRVIEGEADLREFVARFLLNARPRPPPASVGRCF